MLKLTEIRIKKIEDKGFLGYASVCIDNTLVISGIKLFESKDGNRFIVMPGQRIKEQNRTRKYYYPITDEFRIELLNKISAKFNETEE